MGFIDRITDSFRIRQNENDDDYYLDDDFDDSDYYDEPDEQPAPRTIFPKRQKQSQPESTGRSLFQRSKVTQIPEVSMEVTMKKPATLDDSRDICDDLLDGRAVVINLEGINTDTAQRIIDFTLGAVYSIGGDLQMISKYIFIASPHTVELSGDFTGDFAKMSSSSDSRARSNAFAFNG